MKARISYWLLLLLLTSSLLAQQYLVFQAGTGLPDLIHGSIGYQHGLNVIALEAGAMPDAYSDLTAAGIFYQRHFGKPYRFENLTPWYVQMGLHYLRDETSARIFTDWYLCPRAGYDVYLTPQLALTLNLGVSLNIYHHEERITPPGWFHLDLAFPILPSGGIALQYRWPVRSHQVETTLR